MLLRIAIVVVVVCVAFVAIRLWNRRSGSVTGVLPAGLTLVEAPDCRACADAKHRFEALGATYRVVDVAMARTLGISVLTVPVAVVGASDGRSVMIRRGSAVVSDAEALVDAAAVSV